MDNEIKTLDQAIREAVRSNLIRESSMEEDEYSDWDFRSLEEEEEYKEAERLRKYF